MEVEQNLSRSPGQPEDEGRTERQGRWSRNLDHAIGAETNCVVAVFTGIIGSSADLTGLGQVLASNSSPDRGERWLVRGVCGGSHNLEYEQSGRGAVLRKHHVLQLSGPGPLIWQFEFWGGLVTGQK